MAWKIADLFVQFAIGGVEVVVKAVDQVKTSLEKVQQGAAVFGRIATAGFAAASVSMWAFVHSGLAASNMGVLLNFQFERLSRSIAGLFGPEIRKLIDNISKLTGWIEHLSAAKKEMIARFLMGAAAALAVATTLPYVLSGVTALIAGVRTLTAAVLGLEGAATGGLLPLLGAAAAAFVALAVGTEVGRNGLTGFWNAVKPIIDGIGQLFGQLATALAPLMETLSAGLETWMGVVGRVFGAVVSAVGRVIEALGHVLSAFYALRPALGEMGSAWSALIGTFIPLIDLVGQVVASFIDDLVPVLQAAVIPALKAMIGAVTWLMQTMTKWYSEVILPLFSGIADLGTALHGALSVGMLAVIDLFQALWTATEPFRDLIFALGDVFLYFARTVLQVVIDQLQKLAETLHFIAAVIRALVGNKLDFNLPKFETRKPGNREQLPLRTGGFEDIGQTYKRIAEASVKVGTVSIPEKQLEEQKTTNRKLDDLEEAVKGNKPPIL